MGRGTEDHPHVSAPTPSFALTTGDQTRLKAEHPETVTLVQEKGLWRVATYEIK